MSRTPDGGPEALTGTGTTTAGVCPAGDSASAPTLWGISSGAWRRRSRSTGRCQTPSRPGRFAAAGASKRIAPGRGQKSAAVVVE